MDQKLCETIAENFPNLEEEKNIQAQEGCRNPNRNNQRINWTTCCRRMTDIQNK
jgi:hypothetical protein